MLAFTIYIPSFWLAFLYIFSHTLARDLLWASFSFGWLSCRFFYATKTFRISELMYRLRLMNWLWLSIVEYWVLRVAWLLDLHNR